MFLLANTHTEQPEIYTRNRLIGALTDISQTMDSRISQLISFPLTAVRAWISLSFFFSIFFFFFFWHLCCCWVFFFITVCVFCLACLVVNYNKALMPKVKFVYTRKKRKLSSKIVYTKETKEITILQYFYRATWFLLCRKKIFNIWYIFIRDFCCVPMLTQSNACLNWRVFLSCVFDTDFVWNRSPAWNCEWSRSQSWQYHVCSFSACSHLKHQTTENENSDEKCHHSHHSQSLSMVAFSSLFLDLIIVMCIHFWLWGHWNVFIFPRK